VASGPGGGLYSEAVKAIENAGVVSGQGGEFCGALGGMSQAAHVVLVPFSPQKKCPHLAWLVNTVCMFFGGIHHNFKTVPDWRPP